MQSLNPKQKSNAFLKSSQAETVRKWGRADKGESERNLILRKYLFISGFVHGCKHIWVIQRSGQMPRTHRKILNWKHWFLFTAIVWLCIGVRQMDADADKRWTFHQPQPVSFTSISCYHNVSEWLCFFLLCFYSYFHFELYHRYCLVYSRSDAH